MRNLQLLRSRAYISDATMELTPDSLDSTRVVVTLRSRDSWTISADAALHGEGRTMISLSDANIFGSGNRLSVATNFSRNDFGYGGNVVSYDIPNFLGSFYKANFSAGRDFYNSELRIGVGKEFILPTDYELGIAYNNVKAKYYLVDRDTSDLAKSKRFDVWAGRSRYIRSIRSSVFLTARYGFARYSLRPDVTKTYNPAFHDTDDVLVGLGLYREKFYTTNMIYGFGTREYLATGYKAELVGGYSWREFGEDMYMGLSYKAGGFTRAGYLMGGFSLGSFIDLATGQWTQSAVDVYLRWVLAAVRVETQPHPPVPFAELYAGVESARRIGRGAAVHRTGRPVAAQRGSGGDQPDGAQYRNGLFHALPAARFSYRAVRLRRFRSAGTRRQYFQE